ncbi:SRPBCC family protein [Kallotenue papyrolyticum]|uniref:SRPBCC family protein n=1 Tax=Kallotenue papyrolyticum TaxID=1325125 RepID=UPI0004708BE0|nr:SRPBCC family protein [Kallotenue papyrolyticum]
MQATGRAARQPNIGALERWLSAFGGGALVALGLLRRSVGGLVLAGSGGYLIYRGMTGVCPAYRALGIQRGTAPRQLRVEQAVTIERPADELYRVWRDFEQLPRFMRHLESVVVLDERRSRWTARAPGGTSVSWEAEIVEDRPGELIRWRSLPDAAIENQGEVRFAPATGGRGSVVRVTLDYRPPAGAPGALIASLFGEEPGRQVRDDLRRFKQLIETGEIATTAGQPHGPRSLLGKTLSPRS